MSNDNHAVSKLIFDLQTRPLETDLKHDYFDNEDLANLLQELLDLRDKMEDLKELISS